MSYNASKITLGDWLHSEDSTIRRNAMSILKLAQNCDHAADELLGDMQQEARCMYCFKPMQAPRYDETDSLQTIK